MRVFSKSKWVNLFGVAFLSPFIYLFVVTLLPYLYTPPALSARKLAAYERVRDFMQAHRQFKSLSFTNRFGGLPYIEINGETSDLRASRRTAALRKYLTTPEIEEALAIKEDLAEAGCAIAEIEGKMILFEPTQESLFLPHVQGVLYAMDGQDPNKAGGPLVAGKRPWMKIFDRWYTADKFFAIGEGRLQNEIPDSIIDLSERSPR